MTHHHHVDIPPPSFPHHHNTTTTTNHHRRQQQHYIPHTSSSASLRGCCCCLILVFSFLILLALTLTLVIILAVKPKKPQFNLQNVAVQYITLTPTSTSTSTTTLPTSASLSLAIQMLFTAKNENKVGIKYGDSTFNIMYRGIPLGRGRVPGFYQPAHSVRQIQSLVNVDRVNLMQSDAFNLLKDAQVNDRVEFRILGDVNAKITIIGLTSPSVQASVDCTIAISPSKRALIYKQCGFDGLQV
uniref:uncharacterized protein LOC122593678 n=1 Tax=Erigeron canadensis TaxID=72917 RepID=UPI001CB9A465|nr:uncharacterized protein LOC122593678 [Erigeron canadensis]